jgi:hypothetical protein
MSRHLLFLISLWFVEIGCAPSAKFSTPPASPDQYQPVPASEWRSVNPGKYTVQDIYNGAGADRGIVGAGGPHSWVAPPWDQKWVVVDGYFLPLKEPRDGHKGPDPNERFDVLSATGEKDASASGAWGVPCEAPASMRDTLAAFRPNDHVRVYGFVYAENILVHIPGDEYGVVGTPLIELTVTKIERVNE